MHKKITRVIGLAMLALFSLCPPAQAAVEIGQPTPALMVRDLSDHSFDLTTLKNKVVIVHFWATWCAPCKEEMPVLDAFYRAHHGQGVEMIALSADSPRHRDDVKEMMKAYSFPAAMLRDVSANDFGTPDMIPLTYIVDMRGIVRAKLSPDKAKLTDKSLSDAIMPLL